MFFFNSPAERDNAEEGLLEDEKIDDDFVPRRPIKRTLIHRWWSWILQSLAFVCSLTLFILSQYKEPSDVACDLQLSTWSPALEAVSYHQTTFQGKFYQPSPYRGTPTPELDWQWEEIIEASAFDFPVDKVHLLNMTDKNADKWHYTERELGSGVAASAWGFHQIHCLNILRQISYKEEYHKQGRLPRILREPPKYIRDHADHCIELIRQDMVCRADVTPYLILDEPNKLGVDFSITKKCRDFDQIRRWIRSHTTIESFKDSFVRDLHSR
ncbi:hypothetical protein BDV96DRAFT_107512 [Lophiotrema nucula]|uniref:Tat pathway signal sequence n=1 Tax=Lophiotrema nucula TaxID=690887 RepID=A0A6A5Z3S3_9PLEO|nr:hypothetical protein BDV96DRAFT_107512 [Lophiotrema nucula]